MANEQPTDLLHGITLKDIIEDLVLRRGWEGLAAEINIRCFNALFLSCFSGGVVVVIARL